MKKGFSLIEILQTVILLGIIAGLSISFFKRLNNDDKLASQTISLLNEAVEEAGRQICSDATPACNNGDDTLMRGVQAADNVDTKYCGFLMDVFTTVAGKIKYNTNTGYCEYELDNDTTPCEIYTINNTSYMVFEKKQDDPKVCYITPYCGYLEPSVPVSNIICKNGVPDYSVQRIAGITEICRRLNELVNHKIQGGSESIDLITTCNSDVHECFKNNTCKDLAGNYSTNTSMILPNGVRLYNLGSKFNDGDSVFVYIKYDRIDDIKTADVTSDTSKLKKYTTYEYKIVNPAGVGDVNSP